ncbi:GNAT family protein [Micrococcus terreus]|uniref:GNAT family N-acetyltransferase n=1 Tax=Micrococcus terreus TaxID=574650 RepID=UPI003015962D
MSSAELSEPPQPPPGRGALLPAWFPSPEPADLTGWWPLFGLRAQTERLVLRPIADPDLPALLAAVQSGIHPTGQNPFGEVPWSQAPAQDVARQTLQHIWRSRANTGPQTWTVQLGVWDRQGDPDCPTGGPDGALIGLQDIAAEDFHLTRTIRTGSWLHHEAQGQGLGTQARAIGLILAFDHWGALAAETNCADWNQASQGVSMSLGYRFNGAHVRAWGRETVTVLDFHLTPDEFRRPAAPVEITGIEAVRRFLRIPQMTPFPTTAPSPSGETSP